MLAGTLVSAEGCSPIHSFNHLFTNQYLFNLCFASQVVIKDAVISNMDILSVFTELIVQWGKRVRSVIIIMIIKLMTDIGCLWRHEVWDIV